jgi:5-methyltetrahydropteroyltriglutamate--homocysteine methyltransferase
MFTATKDLILPSTTTGSFPRPRWFDVSMWGKPLDTCMLDVRFREKLQDALAVVISDQERAGLDVLTHGDFHVDEDMAGRAWHHYPLQRWAGFEGDYLQPEETTAPWLHYPPGTLLNEIYTGWRWPHVVDKIEHRPLDYPKLWRMAQAKTRKPVKFGRRRPARARSPSRRRQGAQARWVRLRTASPRALDPAQCRRPPSR